MRKRSTKYYRNSNINFDIAYLSPTGQTCTWVVQTCFPRTNLSPSRMLSQWPISFSWILSRPTHRHRILLQMWRRLGSIHGLLHPLPSSKLILVVQFFKEIGEAGTWGHYPWFIGTESRFKLRVAEVFCLNILKNWNINTKGWQQCIININFLIICIFSFEEKSIIEIYK